MKKPSRLRRTQRRFRTRSNNLEGTPLQTHLTYLCSDIERNGGLSVPGYLVFQLTIDMLVSQYKDAFDEFCITWASVVYIPHSDKETAGNYTITLLDNRTETISDGPTKWSQRLYKIIARYPGSKIRKTWQSSKAIWYPSEPFDRNYHRINDDALNEPFGVFTLAIVKDYAQVNDNAYLLDGQLRVSVRMFGRAIALRKNPRYVYLHNRTNQEERQTHTHAATKGENEQADCVELISLKSSSSSSLPSPSIEDYEVVNMQDFV